LRPRDPESVIVERKMPSPVTPAEFKAAMSSFGAGVTVVTTLDPAGKPSGLTVTAFTSVSKSPPLCLVCIGHEADAYPVMKAARSFAVNFLTSTQTAIAAQFATHGIDKFAGLHFHGGPKTGSPVLEGTLACIECVVTEVVVAGDHDILIGTIEHVEVREGEPLAYFRGRYCDVVPRR
jgi:flavin reductase (DIM6/NTAB) family NADH-FMN oxidoreductase RutF